MDQPPWVYEDPMNCISTDLKEKLSSAVRRLYLTKLIEPKATFHQIILEIENELNLDHPFVDDVSLKLARDLDGYVSLEDATWLLEQRADRASAEVKFRAFLNCVLITEHSGDSDLTEKLNKRLKNEADLLNEPVRMFLVNVMLCMAHHWYNRTEKMEQTLTKIKAMINQENSISLRQEISEENVFYLIIALERVAFLLKKTGDKKSFEYYHRKAIDLCQRRKWDLGLRVELETNLIRALRPSGTLKDMSVLINDLLIKIKEALQYADTFEVRYGMKILREAYNDISVACSFLMIAKDQLLSIGEQMYALWKDTYGAEHHEVIFIASQLVYNYETFELEEDADRYLDIVENAFERFPETTKMIMQAKAKALIHLWMRYENKGQLDRAEYYCRERVRVNRKHGLSQQYVANSLRSMAFVVRDQGRREEGLNYLKECLQLSKDFSPTLTAFHRKVENEIKKF